MMRRFLLLCLGLYIATLAYADVTVRVVMTTDRGEIEFELYPEKAPRTVANFLRYVDAGFYDGGFFHRTVKLAAQEGIPIKIEVIQGGTNPARKAEEGLPIALERTRDTGLQHRDGVISMARLEPDTGLTDFFICIGDQPELDFGGRRNPDGQGFAAFGRVVRGIGLTRVIHQAPAEGQKLSPPVAILSIRRMDSSRSDIR